MKSAAQSLSHRLFFVANLVAFLQFAPFMEVVSFASAVDRAQDDYDDAKKAESGAKKDYNKCVANLGATSSSGKQAASSCDDLKDQWKQAQQDTKSAKKKLDRAQDQAEQADKKGPPGSENCVECNKEKEKYNSKSGWESFADVVKAATPLGLGAMNLYGGVKAMNLQSSDYQTYANSMSAAGLPFSQNTNGYGGILGSMVGSNNMLSMLGMMNSGSGSATMGGMSGMSGTGMTGMSGMSMGSYGMMGGMTGSGGMSGGMIGMSGIVGGYSGTTGMSGMLGMSGMSGMLGGFSGGLVGMSGITGSSGYAGAMTGYSGAMGYGNSMYGGLSGMNGGFSPYGGGYGSSSGFYGGYAGNSGAAGYYPSGYGSYMGGNNSGGVGSMYPASPYGFPGNAYPYANAYSGMNGNGFGGLTSYNPWSSTYNSQLNAGGLPAFYSNQQSNYGGQLRMAQQNAVTSQDAQAAQQALYTAQTRYQQVLGNMSGSYTGTNYPYSASYYGSGYGSSYGGYGSYPSSYSYYPYGYSSSYGAVNNPPALNATRQ